jgi:hypothetical protein
MLVSDIVTLLPASLDWMVLFNLIKLSRLFDEHTIKKMFLIPDDISISDYSHAILTSEGTYLAPIQSNGFLWRAKDGTSISIPNGFETLGQRFAGLVPLYPIDEADCLGLGEIPSFFPPVLLQIRFEGSCGFAKAVFISEPTQINYELLGAVGVRFISGVQAGDHYVADFTVDLNQHIFSGLLSDFSKTGYCNAFFLQHGTVGPTLEAGLINAAVDRVDLARRTSSEAICELARKALETRLTMRCQPPLQKPSFEFGDLVPLGFLLRSLQIEPTSEEMELGNRLEKKLLVESSEGLWAFQSGDIPTATDSALILLGISDSNSVQALECFFDGRGGYFPQLWEFLKDGSDDGRSSQHQQAGKMLFTNWNAHWCQPDYATTCLIRYHRQKAHLADIHPTYNLADAFEERSGLFFANPYLVDWCLALGLSGDQSQSSAQLRGRLVSEILASINPDHTFGSFDLPFSTALAILSLVALGYQGRVLLLAQLRLAQLIQTDGTWQESTPFYSSLRLPDAFAFLYSTSNAEETQLIEIKNDCFAISLYVDSHRIITTAICALALSEMTESRGSMAHSQSESQIPESQVALERDHKYLPESHPRYRCKSQIEYITRWALPPYTRKTPISSY